MSEKINPRTYHSKRKRLVRKFGTPPRDQGAWFAVTSDFLSSAAFLSLNGNEVKAFFRIVLEHLSHGGLENGNLICTHSDFIQAGVGRDRVADAIAGLEFKGIVSVTYGRGGRGPKCPNTFRLTLAPNFDGEPPTHDWRNIDETHCLEWKRKGGARASATAQRRRQHALKRRHTKNRIAVPKNPHGSSPKIEDA